MECLALELAQENITVNGVCPGNIDTEMWANLVRNKSRITGISEEAYRQKEIDGIPMKRLGRPTEVADAFVFLASSLASYISGETINVDGAELSG
jgi:NAD(P)-dependent dehydrogenase (short-subunit alcohol dehydrogenase family)